MKNILTIGLVLSLVIGAQATTNAKLNVEKANQNDLQIKLESTVDVYGLQFDVNYDLFLKLFLYFVYTSNLQHFVDECYQWLLLFVLYT